MNASDATREFLTVPVVPDLDRLERAVDHALRSLDSSSLVVLGYGEISSVLRWSVDGIPVACKRLPLFRDIARLEQYRETLNDYLDALSAGGISVLPTSLQTVSRPDGAIAAYCVQPVLEPAQLAPQWIGSLDDDRARLAYVAIVDRIVGAVRPTLGLDGQVSNWAFADGELRYLDVSTPMLRDAAGRDRLDTELFLASLPAAIRPAVRRWLLKGIVDKYFDPRGVALDLVGNLFKERLERHVPMVLDVLRERVAPAITREEALRYYRDDARTWALLQRLRRIDRAWQRGIRRRTYPFLLPGAIER